MKDFLTNKKMIVVLIAIIILMIIAIIISVIVVSNNNKEIEEVQKVYRDISNVEKNNRQKQTDEKENKTLIAILESDNKEEQIGSEEAENQNETNLQPLPTSYQGYETIGKITIPKTNLDTFILKQVTVPGMEIALCLLYSTGELNKTGNNLIVGHNYRNEKLFSNNKYLEIGDTIQITSLDGSILDYTIYNKFVTTDDDVSFLKRSIGDKPEITLSCCTDDDNNRIIILARAN